MSLLVALGLVAGGLVAGVINTVAGGGSLLTLPLLMEVGGLDAVDANGTNRLGVLVGSVTASARFHKDGALSQALDRGDAAWAVLGALLGALLSLPFDEAVFRRVVGVVLLVMLGVLLARPTARLGQGGEPSGPVPRALGYLAIGLYGGFIQAGVGVLLATGGVLLSGRSLAEAHAAKVAIVAWFTLPALAVFAMTGHVAWLSGALLAVGSSLGGWIGARFTASWGPGVLRALLVAAVLAASWRLLLA